MIALCSCAKIGPEPATAPAVGPAKIYIPIVNENDSAEAKAYYYETNSYWTYVWEDQDSFNYFRFNRGTYLGDGSADVLKTPSSTLIGYAASDLEVGNTIYSYFLQKDLWMNEIVNDDPSRLKLIIPTNQVTTNDPEQFREQVDCALTVSGVSLSKQSAEGDAGTLHLGNVSIPDNVLYFTINNYNPEFTYLCKCDSDEGGVSDFTVNADGTASVTVSFDVYPSGEKDQATDVKIYNSKFNKNYVTITVKAHRDGNKGTSQSGRVSKYSWEITGSGSSVGYVTSFGPDNPYPIRDAMPCVSRAKIVTSSLLAYPEDIANSMTMYMLGSAAEFRIYSSTGRFADEDIVKVVLTTTNAPSAGFCYYDIESESLEITGCDQNTITSDVSECGYKVPTTKGGEESVYLVLAPGTYDLVLEVYTRTSQGKLMVNKFLSYGKEFTRANRKPFAVNLESASNTRYEYAEEGGEEGNEDEM